MRIAKSAALTLLAASFYVAPAHAQATRTWVSGVGDDANPCSRTAPCKTFAGAISKTATGGEINCLDPGGFGGVTITKALSIVCQYTEGGVLVAGAGVNGIIVNAPATSSVYLRGLDIFGAGTAQNGVRFIAGAALHIEDSVLHGFNAANGLGLSFQPSGASELFVTNSTVTDNGSGATGGGILIQPTGAAGSAKVVIDHVRINNNANAGFRVDTTGNTAPAGVNVLIDSSSASGNTNGVVMNLPVGTTGAVVIVTNSIVAMNSGIGLQAIGAAGRMRVGNSTISQNGTGASASGGASIGTYGTNRLNENTVSDGALAPLTGQQ